MTARGFGLAAAVSHEVIRAAASACEALGYRTFWVNDTPDGDGLAALAAAASVTSRIALGVGVLPLSRWTPERIAGAPAPRGESPTGRPPVRAQGLAVRPRP